MTKHWHFSVRHLLILTAIVSFVLLFAVKWLPVFLVVCFWVCYLAGMAGLVYVTSAERHTPAIVAWLFMGVLLAAVAVINISLNWPAVGGAGPRWITAVVSVAIGGFGLLGFYRAWHAYSRAKVRRAALHEAPRVQTARLR